MHSTEEIQKQIGQIGLVAAIRCRAALDGMLELGDALHAAPLTAVMISAGSVEPWQIVAEMRHRYGRSMAIGAGPLHTQDAVSAALAAGAHFVMSTAHKREIGEMCRRQGALYIPLVQRSAHVYDALDAQWHTVSCFPVHRSGSQPIADLVRRFPTMRILAAGGVNAANLGDFARAGAAAVVVRGVLGVETRWRMNEIILHMRRLRAAWDAARLLRE
jgi:2-keto-3-deoxy-6-phosphogluconate aldolase